MAKNKRRVVQIATSVAYDSEDDRSYENLYVLDSDGFVWMWVNSTSKEPAGWVALAQPWENVADKKSGGDKV